MNDLKMFDAINTDLRTGLSANGSAFVLASDMAVSLGARSANDITKNLPSNSGEYKGQETVDVGNGERRKVNVLYKRGVFHVLMVSRKPEALAFKDRLFDFLEEYEREGFVVKDDITPQQSIRLIEKLDYKQVLNSLAYAQDYRESGLSPKAFANMQNGFYKVTIGTTAADLRRTRELPDKATVKDFLTDEELSKMQGLSMMIIGKLRARHPNGEYTVRQFADLYHEVVQAEMDRKGLAV